MSDNTGGERLRWALDLAAFAENLMRHRFHQENPQATEDEIEDRLLRWMRGVDYSAPRPKSAQTRMVAP